MIPGSAEYLDKKTFNWTLSELDEEKIEIRLIFDNPTYISAGDYEDIVKISFFNTPLYLVPDDPNKSAIPNGWELNIMLPPQKAKVVAAVVDVAPKTTKNGLMTLITANAWLTFLFGVSMQPLFDMINSLQITALLPLTQLTIPSNVMELFEVSNQL